MYYPVMRPGAQRQLKRIGQADLVIGLLSYKNKAIAAHTARVALDGAHAHFPHLKTVLVNADAGYYAETRQAVAAQASQNGYQSFVVSGRYEGPLGQGNATAALFDAALALDAKAIVILSTDAGSITPLWIPALAHLVLHNKADLVLPRYRQWLLPDGDLSDLITYPLFRALWGYSVRHPAASDFALSLALAAEMLDKDIWGTAVAGFGLMPWLTTYGILGQWRVAQSALGQKCIYVDDQPVPVQAQSFLGRSDSRSDSRFKAKFHDVVMTLLATLSHYAGVWEQVVTINSIPTLTQFSPEIETLPSPQRDISGLLDNLALGWMEYRLLWQDILAADNLAQLEALAALPPDRFYFPSDLWARIICDYAVAFNQSHADPVQMVDSLYPLFQGRLGAFWQEIAGLALVGQEGTVAAQAVEFEEARDYLTQRWHSYKP